MLLSPNNGMIYVPLVTTCERVPSVHSGLLPVIPTFGNVPPSVRSPMQTVLPDAPPQIDDPVMPYPGGRG